MRVVDNNPDNKQVTSGAQLKFLMIGGDDSDDIESCDTYSDEAGEYSIDKLPAAGSYYIEVFYDEDG